MVRASHPYDNSYDPAAPVISIGLGPSGSDSVRREVAVIVDTGADVTMIPTDILKDADDRLTEQGSLRGILGRDVLNQLEIVLNGPAQELWVA